jgi:hypothetical protein
MAAEFCPAATLNRRHGLELAEAYVSGIRFAPRSTVAAENIRDLNS